MRTGGRESRKRSADEQDLAGDPPSRLRDANGSRRDNDSITYSTGAPDADDANSHPAINPFMPWFLGVAAADSESTSSSDGWGRRSPVAEEGVSEEDEWGRHSPVADSSGGREHRSPVEGNVPRDVDVGPSVLIPLSPCPNYTREHPLVPYYWLVSCTWDVPYQVSPFHSLEHSGPDVYMTAADLEQGREQMLRAAVAAMKPTKDNLIPPLAVHYLMETAIKKGLCKADGYKCILYDDVALINRIYVRRKYPLYDYAPPTAIVRTTEKGEKKWLREMLRNVLSINRPAATWPDTTLLNLMCMKEAYNNVRLACRSDNATNRS